MIHSIVPTNRKGGMGKSTSETDIAVGPVEVLRHLNVPNMRVLNVIPDDAPELTGCSVGAFCHYTNLPLLHRLNHHLRLRPQVL